MSVASAVETIFILFFKVCNRCNKSEMHNCSYTQSFAKNPIFHFLFIWLLFPFLCRFSHWLFYSFLRLYSTPSPNIPNFPLHISVYFLSYCWEFPYVAFNTCRGDYTELIFLIVFVVCPIRSLTSSLEWPFFYLINPRLFLIFSFPFIAHSSSTPRFLMVSIAATGFSVLLIFKIF